MSQPSLSTVPNEVIVLVLENLYESSGSKTFAKQLETCKQWYELGTHILWRDIYLELRQLESFLTAMPPARCNLVHSMTVNLNGWHDPDLDDSTTSDDEDRHTVESVDTISVSHALDLVSSSMGNMPNLTALSCSFQSYGMSDENLASMSQLLRKLPASIRDLELVNCLVDRPENEDHHICREVARLLPQLQRLQISGTPFCPRMFTEVKRECPLLKTVVIDGTEDRINQDCVTFGPQHRVFEDYSMVTQLINAIRAQLQDGRFPNITRLTLLGERFDHLRPVDTLEFLYSMDILRATTTIYPLALVVTAKYVIDDGLWMRYLNPLTNEEIDVLDIAQGRALVRLVEGPIWRQWNIGLRLLPRQRSRHHKYSSTTTDIIDYCAKDLATYRHHHPLKSRLWYWEERVGRKLVHVQTVQGTDLPACPTRECPDEELALDPASELAQQLIDLKF